MLRLVQSGIPASADWDDFYEDTGRGWKVFLAGLKHYLEKHLGQARDTILFMHPITIPIEELEVGSRASLTTTFGQNLEVEVLVREPPNTLSMTIDNLEDSLLALDFERIGGKILLYANLSAFGLDPSQVGELRIRWKEWIDRLFPVRKGATA